MPKTTQTRVIKILTKDESSKPVERISKQFSKLNNNIKKTAKNSTTLTAGLSRAKTVFMGFAAAMGARQVTKSIDSFQLLKDRISALWGPSINANNVMQKLAKAANETNAPIATLADGFARMSLSTKDMGLSVDETIRGVKSLQQTLRLSGSGVQEANSVFLQFSQSMGLSRIQGQELRAVMLGDAKMAELLAKEFDTTKGKLRDLGEKGMLSAIRAFKMLIREGESLDTQAGKLKVTFGQLAVKTFNAFGVAVDKLNTKFTITTTAAKAIKVLTDNMNGLFSIATVISTSAVFYKIATSLMAVEKASIAISATKFFSFIMGSGGAVLAAGTLIGSVLATYLYTEEKILGTTEKLNKAKQKQVTLEKLLATAKGTAEFGDVEKDTVVIAYKKKLAAQKKYVASLKRQKKMEDLLKGNISGNKQEEKGEFAALNKLYRERNGITDEYIKKLREYERLKISKRFEEDKISALSYESALIQLNEKFDKLLNKIDKVKNSSGVFNGIKRGAMDTLKSIGTVADQIADVTTKAFSHLEDALVEFTKKGKIDFASFTMAILDDINRMIIRMAIIKPLAGALGSAMTSSSSGIGSSATYSSVSSTGTLAANGNVFTSGNVIPFATGGVVNSPTNFGMSRGRTGLMGEAGPEAILPLSRGANGKLGVTGSGTVVNVINNSSAETETKRSTSNNGTEQIDIYIVNKVGEAIGEGQYDRSFKQLYGLNRKGS